MNYTSYRLEFFNGVRFGHGNLDSTDISFHADTLFSALYQEALKLNKENLFLEFVENDRLLFSDGFPYIGKEYFIPKPMLKLNEKFSFAWRFEREKS